jgi:hypothetical protein
MGPPKSYLVSHFLCILFFRWGGAIRLLLGLAPGHRSGKITRTTLIDRRRRLALFYASTAQTVGNAVESQRYWDRHRKIPVICVVHLGAQVIYVGMGYIFLQPAWQVQTLFASRFNEWSPIFLGELSLAETQCVLNSIYLGEAYGDIPNRLYATMGRPTPPNKFTKL